MFQQPEYSVPCSICGEDVVVCYATFERVISKQSHMICGVCLATH